MKFYVPDKEPWKDTKKAARVTLRIDRSDARRTMPPMFPPWKHLLVCAAAIQLTRASACSTCGCSFNSDWETQGLATGSGFRYDLRFDTFTQNQMRLGTEIANPWPAAGHEQELYTRNHYTTVGLDYSPSENWGLNLQVPYIERTHATNGVTGLGTDDGTSSASGLGDVRLTARYQGFNDSHDFGVLAGLKLPTGGFHQTFNGGSLAGDALDRGLQLGTGTTDLLVGVFRFGQLGTQFDYFAQALAQVPLNSREDYRPGKSLNLNLGFRYLGFGNVIPQLQLNGKISSRDAGANASPDDSGGRTLTVSPGVAFPVTANVRGYAFWQLPVYQNLNGYQLAPKSLLTIGARIEY